MKKVIEFLLKLDPNSNNVLERCVNDEKKIQHYYRAQMFLMIEKYLGCKPFFDRILTRLVDQDDCMYVHNDFVKPGDTPITFLCQMAETALLTKTIS